MKTAVLNNYGFIQRAVPPSLRAALECEIASAESKIPDGREAKLRLSGRPTDGVQIVESLDQLRPFLIESVKAYDEAFNYIVTLDWLTGPLPLDFDNVWINFQKKHDYVPPHVHSGILSYVIWARIPYDLEEEFAEFPTVDSSQNTASCFSFIYQDVMGRQETYPIALTKEFEWEMILFPSKLMHFVNPFRTSDQVRVSISGNIRLKV